MSHINTLLRMRRGNHRRHANYPLIVLRQARENLQRSLAVICSAWLDALYRRCYAAWMRRQYKECHAIARRICWMGFDNDKRAQDHLSRAKDELYSAALRFKAEADSASNEKLNRREGERTQLNT